LTDLRQVLKTAAELDLPTSGAPFEDVRRELALVERRVQRLRRREPRPSWRRVALYLAAAIAAVALLYVVVRGTRPEEQQASGTDGAPAPTTPHAVRRFPLPQSLVSGAGFQPGAPRVYQCPDPTVIRRRLDAASGFGVEVTWKGADPVSFDVRRHQATVSISIP
jgi:hypothetical protein